MGNDKTWPVKVVAEGNPLRSRTGYLLIELGTYAKTAAEQALAPLGLRPRHISVLVTLASETKPLSQQEVSRSLGIDPNVMVGLMDDLEDLGLAERQRNPSDRRRHVVRVTDEGLAMLVKAAASLDEAEAAVFSAITPEEKAYVHGVLNRLLTAVSTVTKGRQAQAPSAPGNG